MDILVCIKQVPDDSIEITFDAGKNAINFNDATDVVNAFDTYALEMATRHKEAVGGEITVLSIGPDSAKNSLKNCLAVGADKAAIVIDDEYQDRDPKAIADMLAKAIKDLETANGKPFDLIMCGNEATDHASGQVGNMLANALQVGVVSYVVDLEAADDKVRVKHETEAGYDLIEASLPVVLTVEKPKYDPRYPTVKSKMTARKKPIEELAKADVPAAKIKVLKVYGPAKREGGVKIQKESAQEAVAEAMALIDNAKVL